VFLEDEGWTRVWGVSYLIFQALPLPEGSEEYWSPHHTQGTDIQKPVPGTLTKPYHRSRSMLAHGHNHTTFGFRVEGMVRGWESQNVPRLTGSLGTDS